MAFFKQIAGAAGAGVLLGSLAQSFLRWKQRALRTAARSQGFASPLDLPWRRWRSVLARFAANVAENRLSALAGAVAFFTLLSMVPALSLFVTLYRFFTDPLTIAGQLYSVTAVLPAAARDLIRDQAMRLATQSAASLSITFLVSLAVAAWSANAAVKAIFDALNIIYGEREKRSFLRLNLISLLTTLSSVVLLAIALVLIAILPVITAFFPFHSELEQLIGLVRWPAFIIMAMLAIGFLYWVGPSRKPPRFIWVIPGAVVAALLWTAASWAFSLYVSTLGNYTATYGSLATVVVFMTWLWLSAMIVLGGAELNAELEQHTAREVRKGRSRPLVGRIGRTGG